MAEIPKETARQKHSGGHERSISQSSLSTKKSMASARPPQPSTIKTVVTAPPWAQDEPPSPTENVLSPSLTRRPSDAGRPSDVTVSTTFSGPAPSAHSWSAFAPRHPPPRNQPPPPPPPPPQGTVDNDEETPSSSEHTPTASPKLFFSLRGDRSWRLPSRSSSADNTITYHSRNSVPAPSPIAEEPSNNSSSHNIINNGGGGDAQRSRPDLDRGLTIRLPPPPTPSALFTMHQAQTPGWQTPWTPRRAHQPFSVSSGANGNGARGPYWNVDGPDEFGNGLRMTGDEENSDPTRKPDEGTTWARRRKRVRGYLLNNVYVPLLFRFINITFTTAALAIAIRIRAVEKQNHIMGAVGSSPTLVIIFAPLTLVHVLAAIYLEYFGRPLGLWRTSHKLAHTLFETTFICAWSAALSLCFDNFFTSYIPCASTSTIDWYSELRRPESPISGVELGRHAGGIGDRICDDQLVLIVLVGIGLIMYCTNLVISLFRIFEKVKYTQQRRTWGKG